MYSIETVCSSNVADIYTGNRNAIRLMRRKQARNAYRAKELNRMKASERARASHSA
jgi:hypothetical protein